jgi:hypothetical protein
MIVLLSAVLARADGPPALDGRPTGVRLSAFEAERQGDDILVTWVTVSEPDNQGFNLYRGTTKAGPWDKLNDDLIPSKVPPGSPVGAAYSWLDTDVQKLVTYYYVLEQVSSGPTDRFGPIVIWGRQILLPLVARGR